MKILYAEDEKQLSDAVTEILKIEGFDVYPVYDGEEVLSSVKENSFDLIILDVMMPRLDGIKALSIMRANEVYTPVMMLTAKTQVEDRVEGFNEGADDYLDKPFVMEELIAHINALMRRNSTYKVKTVEYSNFKLDLESNEIKTNIGSLRLSPKEAILLAEFVKYQNRTIGIDSILNIIEGKKEEGAIEL